MLTDTEIKFVETQIAIAKKRLELLKLERGLDYSSTVKIKISLSCAEKLLEMAKKMNKK